MKSNTVILNTTIDKVNKYEIDNLTPNTTYKISVAAGNQKGFGEETITSFTTFGKALLPDKPSKLTVISITSESAGISWEDPANGGNNNLTGFWIKLSKDNTLILNITINKVNKYEIDNLTPNTTYEISVAAGNQKGFGEETITSFTTFGKALLPDKPSKLTVISITSESAGISWEDPANGGNNDLTGFWIKLTKNNTLILNTTIDKVNKYKIHNLNSNTTYEIFVAAGNQNGFGEGIITSFRTTSISTLGKSTGDTDDSSDGYIAGVVTLAVVVNVVLATLAYIIYRYRQLKSAIADYLGEETSAQITTMLKGKQPLKSVIADNLGEETSAQITALLNNGEERLKSAIADNLGEETSAQVTALLNNGEERLKSIIADNLGEEPSTDVTVLADNGRKVSKDINDNNPVQKQVPKVLFKKGQHCLIHKDDDHCEKVELLDIGYV
ncbi:titin isoform X5 [Paramuricea clavata]|uniref:Titin isoform X5 n=2 Tax=Paramuricea clavata TaxID=317549 RepID=A0A7D9IH44_PARCT|nr:titin isoform X5 [Paramuricea clavata]